VGKRWDILLFGATGFTGRLVAEQLQAQAGPDLAWAMAGRSAQRLEALARSLGVAERVGRLTADAADAEALRALVAQARVVITTVGPYQRHGEWLARACAAAGTDYVDLCGEPLWMARMIPLLEAPARASGARIVFSCGFDSVPFDLGVVFLQQHALERFGTPLREVRGRVAVMKGSFSGGTAASLLATLEAVSADRGLARALGDPFLLTPGFCGPVQGDGEGAAFDDWSGAWTAPFVMAPINTKNVHRSNFLRGHPWGRDFVYSERLLTGPGAGGDVRAHRLARTARLQNLLLGFRPTRALIRQLVLPAPGQGPSAAQREAGHYELVFTGATADGRRLSARVRGDRDPGYGSTSRMVLQCARCLLEDVDARLTPGGVWTPGAALGLAGVRRLEASAGLSFTVEDPA
jgi:short subunit dehydrogenase-like uncharacterized protein